jgi:hypothetical protein
MKEKNLHRGPHAPGVCSRWGGGGGGGGKFCILSTFRKMKEKKYHLFHPHGGRVRPPEKPKNKSIILVKLLFHRKRKSITPTVRCEEPLGGPAPRKMKEKCIISLRHECAKWSSTGTGRHGSSAEGNERKNLHRGPVIGDRAVTERIPLPRGSVGQQAPFSPYWDARPPFRPEQ